MTDTPLPTEMNVVEISEFGGPEVLVPAKRDLPDLKADEVLVKVTAAGVNMPDVLQRNGLYPLPPGASDLPGLEISGEVVATGSNVTQWKIGDRVCGLTKGGGYAEFVAIAADHCLPIPAGVDEADAAGLPETFFTVWSNCFFQQTIEPGGLFLVHGGAGGIGSTAVQLGAALGLRVFATVSNAENAAFVKDLGAERAINYRKEDFVEIVTEQGGAAMILDFIGGDYVGKNLVAAAPDARLVQLAFLQGSKVEVNLLPIMLKRITLTGSTLRPRPGDFKAAIAADLRQHVWPLFAEEKLKAVTHERFALADAAKAHAMMEASGHRGKILLLP
ncbi:MAG: NAD(P)H-quinone oxidoreductase [Ahrensia sp.]|nr:NAD(P)H-quinone oxidoreductase [Ahrensia sp.]